MTTEESIRKALERIASTSPAARFTPGHPEPERCACCLALIDEARDALGYQRWPAPVAVERGGR